MNYKVTIPVYLGGEVVENLLATIDVHPSHVILVDNTPDSYCKKFEGKGYTILYYPSNLGVARSWNIGLEAQCDWTFLLSQAAVFPSGFSEFLLGVDITQEAHMTNQGWHVTGISKSCVEKVGLFDTNIWPAFAEDFDYYKRMCLAGIKGSLHTPPVSVPSIGTATSHKEYIRLDKINNYIKSKWGVGIGEEGGWDLPFRDKPLSYFPNKSLKEIQKWYLG